MKQMMLGVALIALIASSPVLPQDQPKPPQAFEVFRINGGFRIVAADGRSISAMARAIEVARESTNAVRLRGNVDINLGNVEISADEVIYHWDTGECEPLGNVHVKPLE